MEEGLISFKTAKLAKEKGFSVGTNGCLVHYISENKHSEDGTSGPFGWKKDEMTFDKSYIVNNKKGCGDLSNEYYNCYECPTQSLLQKWLREKHKINVESNWLPNIQKYRCLFKPMNIIPNTFKSNSDYIIEVKKYYGKTNHKTYEEALEKGLYQALKLI